MNEDLEMQVKGIAHSYWDAEQALKRCRRYIRKWENFRNEMLKERDRLEWEFVRLQRENPNDITLKDLGEYV